MEIQKVKLWAYCRESIDLESGIGIQRELISKYADLHDIEIVDWFIDNNASAYKHRPHFEDMWGRLHQADGVVVSDLTRFGRSDSDLLYRLAVMNEQKKRLILIKEGIDSSRPESEFFLKLLALLAHRERQITRERLAAGLKWAKQHGTKSGKPLGRQPTKIDWVKVDKYLATGISVTDVGRICGYTKSVLYNALKRRRKETVAQ